MSHRPTWANREGPTPPAAVVGEASGRRLELVSGPLNVSRKVQVLKSSLRSPGGLRCVGAAVAAVLAATLLAMQGSGAAAAPAELCGGSTKLPSGFEIAPNVWNSKGELCVSPAGDSGFTVSKSSIGYGNTAVANRGPGAYPYIGTPDDDPRLPLAVNAIGKATTSWSTVSPDSGSYNAAYDLWYAPSRDCGGVITSAASTEVMVWLKSPNLDPPESWRIGSNVQLSGMSWDVFEFTGPTNQKAIIYQAATPVDQVTGLQLAPITQDSVQRGKISAGGWLCKVQAGFEIHDAAPAGLAATGFSFDPAGATAAPAPSTSAAPTATAAPTTPADGCGTASCLFSDDFDGPDGPIGSGWQVTSGAFGRRGGVGWSDSAVFRANTVRKDFGDVTVDVRLRNLGIKPGGPDTDGVHVWLRHQDQYKLYVASVNRRDSRIVIKKKLPGGPDPANGGTYYELGSTAYTIPVGDWQNFTVSIKTVAGAAQIEVAQDGKALLRVEDTGTGGPPILDPGAVGLRSDNTSFEVDTFKVSAAGATTTPSTPAPKQTAPSTAAPTITPHPPASPAPHPTVPSTTSPKPSTPPTPSPAISTTPSTPKPSTIPTPKPPALPIPVATGQPIRSGIAGLCLDDRHGRAIAGDPVVGYACNLSAAQRWQTTQAGTISLSRRPQLCVTAAAAKKRAKVTLQPCDGRATQQWKASSTYRLTGATRLCLDLPKSRRKGEHGTQLIVWPCHRGRNQMWTASTPETPKPATPRPSASVPAQPSPSASTGVPVR